MGISDSSFTRLAMRVYVKLQRIVSDTISRDLDAISLPCSRHYLTADTYPSDAPKVRRWPSRARCTLPRHRRCTGQPRQAATRTQIPSGPVDPCTWCTHTHTVQLLSSAAVPPPRACVLRACRYFGRRPRRARAAAARRRTPPSWCSLSRCTARGASDEQSRLVRANIWKIK